MKNIFLKNVLINLIITLTIGVLSFIINKYFVLYLGVTTLGLMNLFTQLLVYVNLADMGLGTASTYALYRPLAERDYKKISIILNTMSNLYNKISIFILGIGLLFNFIIPFLIKENYFGKYIYMYWSLYVINTMLGYIFIKYNILFIADQKFGLVRLIQGGSRILCQLLQIFIIIKFQSFLGFILMLTLDSIIQFLLYRYYYKNYYARHIIKTALKDMSIVKNLKNLVWHKVGGMFVFNTDLILISKFISLEVVAIYSAYQMIEQVIITLYEIVLKVLSPTIGNFIASNSKENIIKKYKELEIIGLFFSINILFCTYKLINPFIKLWLGNKFIFDKFTLILILINLFIRIFRRIMSIFKDNHGFFDDIYLPISEAVINFIISLILIFYMGINGVIIGTVVSNIIIVVIAIPVLVFKRCFEKTIFDYIKLYGSYLILITISLITCNLITNLIEFRQIFSWKEWILQAISIGIISFGLTFVIFLTNKDFKKFFKPIFNKVRKN